MIRRPVQEGRGKKAAPSSCKYKLTLEYDGTGYSGWQVQKNARSIQGTLIDAARELFGGEVEVQGAGRTDAGVHALAQVAHLDAPHRLPLQKILHGLNDLLPAPINILRVEEAPAAVGTDAVVQCNTCTAKPDTRTFDCTAGCRGYWPACCPDPNAPNPSFTPPAGCENR